MNLVNPYLNQYKKNQVETASQEQILILLYDGAINFLNKAKICIESNDDEHFHKNMNACKNIIIEFMETLDLQQGGQWALTLYKLYKYMRSTIVKADVTKNIDSIDEVLKHLISLRDTWKKAIEIAKEEAKQSITQASAPNENEPQKSIDYYDSIDEDEDEEE